MEASRMNKDAGASCLAVDLGASSGRVLLVELAAGRMETAEIHRFENRPFRRGRTLHWDFDMLWREVKRGLAAGFAEGRRRGNPVSTIGVDTWGVDFALLDAEKNLITPPVHYRDERTDGLMEEVFDHVVPAAELYEATGIQFLPFNTIHQMAALRKYHPGQLSRAWYFLMMPDLLHFHLTGKLLNEYTNATTTQLFNPRTGDWANEVIARLHVPRRIFTIPVRPGTPLGPLLPAVAGELGAGEARVVAVGTHDTASAVAAVPARGRNFVYLSCGTWSLLGTELDEPLINEKAREHSFTNEGGVMGTVRFLKNIMGLWILQEARRVWEGEGKTYSWERIAAMAEEGEGFRSLIDPDDRRFLPPGDMAGRVREYCRGTNQPVPGSDGEVVRCILESLALKYRYLLDLLEDLVGRRFGELHVVGGGIRNAALCRMTANAIGRPVIAGPAEATALGNAGMQFIAQGRLGSLAEMRAVVEESERPTVYQPRDKEQWEAGLVAFRRLVD